MSAKPTTILVVDDTPGSRYTITKMLQKARYQVKEAATAREALRLAAEKPDLVILDVGLPDLNGYEVCQRIKADPATASIPVLHLSASFAETENRVRGLEGGADGYLTYPVEPTELLANVQALLRVREAERQVREQRELLRVTLSSIGDGVIATDSQGRVTFLNPMAQSLTGWSQEEAAGKPLDELFRIVRAETGEPVENPVHQVIREGVGIGMTDHTVLLARDGTRRSIDDSAAPIRDDQGVFVGVVLIFRDVSQRRLNEQRQAMQFAVTRILAESAHIEDGIPQLLRAIGEGEGWDVGQMWLVDRDANVLSCKATWSATSVDRAGFEAASRGARTFPTGDSLPGRVWASGQPLWISDVQKEDQFWRSAAAAPLGLHAAYAFPIRGGSEVIGVAEFLCQHVRPPDEALMGLMADVGRQIGQFVERKGVEEALRKSEERFRAVFDNTTAVIYVVDTAGRFLLVNRRFQTLFHVSNEQAAGKSLEEFFPKQFADAFRENNRKVLEARAALEFEEAVPQGADVHVYVSIKVPLLDANGIPYAVCGVSADISERKRAEETQAFLAAIIESSDDAIVSKTLDGEIRSWNAGAERLFGYTAEEAVGRPITLIIPPERQDEEHEILARIRNGERVEHFETVRVSKHGRRIDISLTVSPVRDNAGRIVGASKVARDITDRKRTEEALREADRRKDEFIALLAHELRNPLAPLRNGLQVMRLVAGDPNAVAQTRDMMERQLGHMVRLIDDLLDISRINRNKMELRRSRVLLEDVLSSAVEAARPLLEAAGHDLTISLPPNPVYLDADLTRLAQVFGNLLTNSVKYTPHGGHIWLAAARQGEEVFISVRDNGIGIPAGSLHSIFDIFSQVDRSIERSTGGLGIGLALVKGLVEMHGGSVAAESPGAGEGSTFTVRLPVLEDRAESMPKALADEEPRAAGLKRRILVADDNQDAATSMAMLLRLMNNEVRTAHDGIEAVEVAEAFRPQVILIDVGMPRLNGYEATRRIREQPWGKPIAIIALTGWGQESDKERSHEAGCDGHLVKPINFSDLENLLAELTGKETTGGK